jgi:hypothetical protein
VSAVADEELGPKLTFEIADLLRERRSRKVKPLRGATEMQFLGDGDEVGRLSKFHRPIVQPTWGDRRGLAEVGHKSWTQDEEER